MRSQSAIGEVEYLTCADPQSVRSHLARIAESSEFAKSPRLVRFLTYVVEAALAGDVDHIKESLIAIEVYGRSPDYNPQIDSTVRVEAGRLRARLRQYYEKAGESEPLRIELPKGSYVPLIETHECMVAPVDRPQADLQESSRKPRTFRKMFTPAVVVLFGIGTAVLLWSGKLGNVDPIDSVAVMPFVNLSGDAETERFCEGLTEELTTALGREARVRVASRMTMAQYKQSPADVSRVGKDQGVRAVLQGSVRRDGHRVVVTTQLINTTSGYHVWADRYEDEVANFFGAQNTFAGRITAALREVFRARSDYRPKTEPADDDTLALYHRAHDLLRIPVLKNGQPSTMPVAVLEAGRLFREVTVRSPEFGKGWAGLAEAAEWEYELRGNQPPERLAEAKSAALRAVQLSPDLVDAWTILTSILFFREWDFKAAEAACRRAIELEPRNTSARERYIDILRVQGRSAQAQYELTEAIKLQPPAAKLRLRRAVLLYEEKHYDEALVEARAASELTNHIPVYPMTLWLQGLCLEQQGQFADAERVFRSALALQPHDPRSEPALGHLLGRMNRREEAEAILSELTSQAAHGRTTHVAQALVYTALGRIDDALLALERGWIERDDAIPFVSLDPRLLTLSSEPRFRALVAKLASGPGA